MSRALALSSRKVAGDTKSKIDKGQDKGLSSGLTDQALKARTVVNRGSLDVLDGVAIFAAANSLLVCARGVEGREYLFVFQPPQAISY